MGVWTDFLSVFQPAPRRLPNNGLGLATRAVRLEEKADSWSADVPIGGTVELMGRVSMVPLRIRKANNYCGTLLAWGSLTWQILTNGVLRLSIRDPLGSPGLPGLITPISVAPGDRVSVNAVNNSGAVVSMGIGLVWDEEHRG